MTSAFSAFQAVPPAPGRGAPTQPAQPAPDPHAGAPQGGGAGALLFPLLLILPLLFLMVWSSRSQQKKQAAVLSSLQQGDRVVLQGGLIGKLAELGDRTAKVELAPGVKVEVLKSGLTGKDGAEAGASDSKKK